MSNNVNIECLQALEPTRTEAVQTCRDTLEKWSIAAPHIEPLVLDFGVDDFLRFGLVELWITNEVSAGYCGKYMFLQGGQSCPEHRHQSKHETFLVVRGPVRVSLGDQIRSLESGAAMAVPPGQRHSFSSEESSLLLEISTPCDVRDNDFTDVRVNAWLEGALESHKS